VGQPPGPLAVADEPILEIKGFPGALESVVSTMSLAQRELVFTCYTVDHPRVLSVVQEKLREGVRVRVLVDGMVLKGETVKNEKAFFRALLGDSSPNLELGVFWAPRNRIKEKGAAGPTGHVKGFGPQLHAKCGTVDGLHFWTGSLNLTSNSETFYEMVSIGRHQPAAALRLRSILDDWWTCCKPMCAGDLVGKKASTDQPSPADTGLS
jgi:phosphatidylserine/phosphatidylglycerophosphate/cardiolipin synthase-like enzyme